ncbi:MAG: hypothetical protein PHP54_04445 [Clostridia bacterium]|nr:hypothetical protein [Clostridia bacterium]
MSTMQYVVALNTMDFSLDRARILSSKKNTRRVSKYKDRKGEIRRQLEQCMAWLISLEDLDVCRDIYVAEIARQLRAGNYSSKEFKNEKKNFLRYYSDSWSTGEITELDIQNFLLLKRIKSEYTKILKNNRCKFKQFKTTIKRFTVAEAANFPITYYNLIDKAIEDGKDSFEVSLKIYTKKDVAKFLLVLDYALNNDKIFEILDVPDVFYVLRQIICAGPDFYFKR